MGAPTFWNKRRVATLKYKMEKGNEDMEDIAEYFQTTIACIRSVMSKHKIHIPLYKSKRNWLSNELVRVIRSYRGVYTVKEVSERMGLDYQRIASIWRGTTYRWVK